ncbi:MAG: nuclear transport factor 2 family protein [Microbacteriaceae bacterium]
MTDATGLLAREQIQQTLRRYSQGLDQRDWSLFLSAFTEDALVEAPGWLEAPISPRGFAEALAGAFDTARLSGQHLLANTLYDIRGDTAHTITEFLASNTERAEEPGKVVLQHAGGLYVDDLARDGGSWRIRHRVLVQKSDNRRVVDYAPETFDLVAGAARNSAVAGF